VSAEPDAKLLALGRTSAARADEKACIEVNHAVLPSPMLGRRSSFSPCATGPRRRDAFRQPERIVETIQRRERAGVARFGSRRRGDADCPSEDIRFGRVPATRETLDQLHRLGIQRVCCFDFRYGHTL
jgi:hypothetical protein